MEKLKQDRILVNLKSKKEKQESLQSSPTAGGLHHHPHPVSSSWIYYNLTDGTSGESKISSRLVMCSSLSQDVGDDNPAQSLTSVLPPAHHVIPNVRSAISLDYLSVTKVRQGCPHCLYPPCPKLVHAYPSDTKSITTEGLES